MDESTFVQDEILREKFRNSPCSDGICPFLTTIQIGGWTLRSRGLGWVCGTEKTVNSVSVYISNHGSGLKTSHGI